jgi:hypothetical protein
VLTFLFQVVHLKDRRLKHRRYTRYLLSMGAGAFARQLTLKAYSPVSPTDSFYYSFAPCRTDQCRSVTEVRSRLRIVMTSGELDRIELHRVVQEKTIRPLVGMPLHLPGQLPRALPIHTT